jgi:hypothetical protein
MEVNFRPIPPSSAIRRSVPGEIPSSDEGQGFLEIIESLTSAENNPEAGEQATQKKGQSKSNVSKNEKEKAGAAEEPEEEPSLASTQSPDQQPTGEKKVGNHLDILA